MNDPLGLWALHAVSVHMGHDVMAHFFFPRPRHVIINIRNVGLHLVDLLLRDRQAQLHLCLSQRDPQLPPGGKFHILRENILHLPTGIPLGKRA